MRPVRPAELETLLPAAVAMFTEEVGVSPLRVDGGAGYRARVTELVRAGHSLAWIEDGEVLFKAEIGAVSRAACQLQGVWVAPAYRGRGIGTAGTAAVVEYARTAIAPVVSLYVNDFNASPRGPPTAGSDSVRSGSTPACCMRTAAVRLTICGRALSPGYGLLSAPP